MFLLYIPLYFISIISSKLINQRNNNSKLAIGFGLTMFVIALALPTIFAFDVLRIFQLDQGELSATALIVISIINLIFTVKFTSKTK